MSAEAVPLSSRTVDELSEFRGALDHEAPFLIEKLLKDHVVAGAFEAETLFTEVKRYLVLTQLNRDVSWQMYSIRVDEVWHQFVLFTREYAMFCEEHLGGFVHHRPSNAPELPGSRDLTPSTFREFRARYREVFGQELPECWRDELSMTLDRRLINEKAGKLLVAESAGRVSLIDENAAVLFEVDSLADEAISFIAATGSFYVRELPGDLTDEERIAIAATLVESRLLRVGS